MLNTNVKRSSILFLYESKNNIPNGDPFTGMQRMDETTNRPLISDVRIKRYIRDQMIALNEYAGGKDTVYLREVTPDEVKQSKVSEDATASAAQIKLLEILYSEDESLYKIKNKKKVIDIEKLLLKCIDVRLFGGVATEKGNNACITGAVQFQMLSPALHAVSSQILQNTSVFQSSVEKKQGSIGTSNIIPYSTNQIVGWVSPLTAQQNGLKEEEVLYALKCLWDAVNTISTRSKQGQYSLLMLKINYNDIFHKTNLIDSLISVNSSIAVEDIRSIKDYSFDFSKLVDYVGSDIVDSIDMRVAPEIKSDVIPKIDVISNKIKWI